MNKGKNIIKKMYLEVDTSNLDDAYYFKDNLGRYFRDEIYPQLEAIFEELNIQNNNSIVRFDQIPIQINISSKTSLEDIKTHIINNLSKKLIPAETENRITKKSTVSVTENKANAFLYYLENGVYPWYFSIARTTTVDLVKHLVENAYFKKKIQSILRLKRVQKRLIKTLENNALIVLFLPEKRVVLSMDKSAEIVPTNNGFREQFWYAIFEHISTSNTKVFSTKMTPLLRSIIADSVHTSAPINIRKTTLEKRFLPLINLVNLLGPKAIVFQYKNRDNALHLEIASNKSIIEANRFNEKVIHEINTSEVTFNAVASVNDPDHSNSITIKDSYLIDNQSVISNDFKNEQLLDEGIIIQNAGLVLLHPFLETFFEKVGVVSNDKKIKQDKIPEALSLLHFLATKEECPEEHEIVFEKFLCGIDINTAVFPAKKLSEKQKQACDELLKAVLSHWEALKTTNIDALRSEFLMREGKLSILNEKEKLCVERKTQDILLEKLPWNLGLLKLPWKKNLVFLDW